MNHSYFDIREYRFVREDQIFPDTNFWNYVLGENGPNSEPTRVYSAALARMLEAGSQLLTDVTVISEFLNAYLRKSWKIHWKATYPDYNNFKHSQYFAGVAEEAVRETRWILQRAQVLETAFDAVAVEGMLVALEQGQRDFNDQVICATCSCHNLTLVTDDRDFSGCSLRILSGNSRLLNVSC